MENLITLIFIIIAVLSVLGKIQPKKKTRADSEASKGWLANLNTFLTDLQDKVEQQTNTNASNSSRWDELMDDEEAEDAYDEDEYSLKNLSLEQDKPQTISAKKEMSSPLVRDQARPMDREGAIPKEAMSPELSATKKTGSTPANNRDDLRKAIIWSEILGPPVALRDPSGNQR